MAWFKMQITSYTIPDETNSVGNCSLHGSVIQRLNKHYDSTSFKNIPSSLTTLMTSYTHELVGDINEFDTTYRKLRNVFKSNIYTFAIDRGVACFL